MLTEARTLNRTRLEGVRPSIPLARALMHPIEWASFSEITFTGQENLDKVKEALLDGKKIIFVSNHMSHADGPVIYAGLSWNGYSDLAEKIVFVAGIRMDKLPATQFLQRRAKTIQVWPPTEEAVTDDDKFKKADLNWKAIRTAKRILEAGLILDMFPQSTRSETGGAMEKAYGEVAGYFTLFPDTLVLPIAILGTDRILPRGRIIPRRGKAGLSVGNLIAVKTLEESLPKGTAHAERRQALIDSVMMKVAGLLPDRYKGYYEVQR